MKVLGLLWNPKIRNGKMDSMAGAHKIVTNQTKTDVQLRSKTIESILCFCIQLMENK